MGTKRPSCTLFDTLSNINTSDRKLQPGGKISRDPSPRPVMTAQSERERVNNREEDWRREREMEKMRDKARYKDMDSRERYYERAPAPRMREGEREWRERERRQEDDRSRNGRPLSNVERDPEKEVERGMKKGDTFPRMRKSSAERGSGRMISNTEIDEEKGERTQRERPRRTETDDWEREREKAWQRERYRERERDEIQSRAEFDAGFQDRGREVCDPRDRRERDATRKREKPKHNVGDREFRMPSPLMRKDRDIYSDRREREEVQRRERKRDTRSEGDSDEREFRRERVRDREREELIYQHSRSEGDNKGKRARERDQNRQGYREEDRQRYRDRDREREVDRSRRRGVEKDRDRYREVDRRAAREADRGGERWKESGRDLRDDRGRSDERREDDRYREYKQRKDRERKEREADSRWDNTTGRSSRSMNKTAPRVPPQSQSSGEWSSDMDSETRYRRSRDSYEERESGRDSTIESERDVEDQRDPERAAERRQRATEISERQERDRGEMTGSVAENRRMWLEPQRGKNSKEESVSRERHTRRKERRKEEERTMKSQAVWGGEGRRVKEEPDERHLDQSGYRQRPAGRNEYRGDIERETEGISVDGEEVGEVWRETDKGGKEYLSDSNGWIDGSWKRDAEGENMTDNTEESDKEEEGGSNNLARSEKEGSESGWKQERDSMLSGEDGFVTLSSGADEDDEKEEDEDEEFEDCQESWEGGVAYDGSSPFKGCEGDEEKEEECTMGKEEAVDEEEQGTEKQPQYVFCVIGQTLPRSKPSDISPSQVDQMGGVEKDNPNLEKCHHCSDDITQPSQDDQHPTLIIDDEYQIVNNQGTEGKSMHETPREERIVAQTTEVDVRYRASSELQDTITGEEMRSKMEHPYAEIGQIKRDSQTERLLIEWREKNKDLAERGREQISPVPSNPYANVCSQANFEQIQPILDGINTGAMSPEEVEAIRIRMSGAWSMSEEPKRHSQAPHLKWAKSVVREILGHSEEQTVDEPNSEEQGNQVVSQSETAIKDNKQQEEVSQATGEIPVVMLTRNEQHAEPGLEEEEPLEVEELRDDEDDRSKSWGEVELRNVLDTIERHKRKSKIFNAAQLYQQYSEAAQNFEILRQSRSDVLSVCEDNDPSPAPSPPPARRPLPPLPLVPHPHSLYHSGSITSVKSLPLPEPPKSERRPSSPRLSISLTQSATLWRDLPGVRNSAELEELTEDQRRLQEVRFEVVTSEASYCRSLDIVVEHFVKSKQLGALLTTQDSNWLFSRLAEVRAVSHSFLSKLEERVETDIIHFTVCDIITQHCQRFKKVYVPYLTNQSYQDATYQRLMNENSGFKRTVEKLERSPVCQRLPLRSFLVLPFQRITRIKLLVQNIVKRTIPGTPEATQAIKALKLLEKMIQESNDSISQMKSIESLVSLSAKVDFTSEHRTFPLISQSRRLVREGPVTELMDFSLKDTEKNIYFHLFNDYLLVSQQKEGGRFTVTDHCPASDLRVENCRVKLHSLQKNLFRLHMSQRSLLLRTDTQSDKLRWMSALSQPHPETDFSAAQDFPQMQCIRSFVAQQPDELSLEKADIILVHQQSSDHWVEGTRLSDRHRGWVPESHLETISNNKVRERNLSDALKLTTARAAV
ncbi:trichohyalin isoform X2 [Toxotes jaculatrix]|uniref:trichohyalin isoform X2 n=1 Tax=Toxotes jaculatrix TaxID=941984 RepID=UPI001B3ACA68|nr:trichohyalin isoform X2 [Toxotes jaculatrix]